MLFRISVKQICLTTIYSTGIIDNGCGPYDNVTVKSVLVTLRFTEADIAAAIRFQDTLHSNVVLGT